jgi:phosphopentomutase
LARRAIIIVLDSVGIGEMPDSKEFGDFGCNTLVNLANVFDEGLRLPHLEALGLGNIASIRGVAPRPDAVAAWGKCAEKSPAKDTTIGHWEIAGLVSQRPFPTYPDGFPREIIKQFEDAIGIETIGNCVASGTEIIQRLGDIHVRTRRPIVYTSADSVFQIATHEEVYRPERLYDMCRQARRILDGPHKVGRVIARPFNGLAGAYERTANRKDFSVEPPDPTLLDILKEAGFQTIGVGKIGDIFDHRGLTVELPSHGNDECVQTTLQQIREAVDGLIFTNLVDTDMLYGHRNDSIGYRRALETFDAQLPLIIEAMHESDLLIITADHGCDPTTPGTDHTREYVPLLVHSKMMLGPCDLGTRSSFADTADTIAEYFSLPPIPSGQSYLADMLIRTEQIGPK